MHIAVKCALGALCLATSLSGCSGIRAQRGYIADQEMMQAVTPGVDNRESVEKMLGRPSVESEFDKSTWYYISRKTEQYAFLMPKATEHKVVAIRFDNGGNVVSIDHFGLNDMRNISPVGDKTETRGKEVGILQQMLGNIGRFSGTPANSTGPRGGGG